MSEEQAWRRQLKGVRAFVETLKEPEAEERETIAGKFAEALGCLEDAACYLRDIDKQYDVIYPDDECEYPELKFWFALDGVIKPLEALQKGLMAVEPLVPKEETV